MTKKHNLADEIKLKKALHSEMKKLEDMETKNPEISKTLQEKLNNHPAREYYPELKPRVQQPKPV